MANNGGTKTSLEPEAARTIITRMGALMDDLSPFQSLRALQTQAGNFSTAAWLKELLQERKDLLAAHGDELKKLMHDLETALLQASAALEQTDRDNADGTTGY